MKKLIFKGSGVALVTPFTDDGINYSVLRDLIEFHIANETDAIIVCGTTGEPATMTENEWYNVVEFSVEVVSNRIPVIAGTGSNSTSHAIERTKAARELYADGALIVTPYYNKTTQRGIVAHYRAICEQADIPVIVYNVPSRTGLNINSQTMYELSKIKNIVGLKEAGGNFSQIAETISLCEDNLYIYSGNDDQVVPMLALGAKGVISVSANIIPKDVHNMVYDFFAGDVGSSKRLQLKAINLINALFFETNPIPVKEAVRQIGFDVGKVRLPLIDVDEIGRNKIAEAIEKYNK